MKKVMVLTIVITLLATSAWAAIRNSKHDLSSSNAGGATIISTNYSETCVFCHTPHGGQTGILAPLWNRSHLGKDYAPGELYNSVTLTTFSKPTVVEGRVTRSDAKLCMSCHDGTVLNGGLRNPANSTTPSNAPPAFAAGLDKVSNNADLGNTLENDHPIGMDYDAAEGADLGGLKAAQGVTGTDRNVNGLPLYPDSGSAGDVMWCSSCHDVHDDNFSPFLLADNAGSALCTSCHNK